jgi:hypothetical protein
MKFNGIVLLICLHTLSTAADLTVNPQQPSGRDWVTFELYNANHNCCTKYHNQQASVSDNAIYLTYEVEDAVNSCECSNGATVSFSSSPLYPGKYRVYKVETPYCDQEPCPEDALIQVLLGEITVSDPSEDATYRVERTGIACFTEPCGHLRIIHQETGDTVLVAGARDTSGQYICIYCRYIIPWLDNGQLVKGYFHTDSLARWVSRGPVFSVTEIVAQSGSTDTLRIHPASTTAEDPITFTLSMDIYSCCADWVADSATVSDGNITLFYSSPLMDCLCLPFWHPSQAVYKLGPVAAGTYSILKQLNPPCMDGNNCPEPTEPPVLLGRITVTDPNAGIFQGIFPDKDFIKISLDPLYQKLVISFEKSVNIPVSLTLFDQSGKQVQKWHGYSDEKFVLDKQYPGIYIMKIGIGERLYWTKLCVPK